MSRTSAPRARVATSAASRSGRSNSYISTQTRRRAPASSEWTASKMVPSCHSRSSPGAGDTTTTGSRAQPAIAITSRRINSRESQLTARVWNLAAPPPTPPVKARSKGLDQCPRPRAQNLVGAAFANAHLHIAEAADVVKRPGGGSRAERRRRGPDLAPIDSQGRNRRLQACEQVAEAVDPEHAGRPRRQPHKSCGGQSQLFQSPARRQLAGRRREPV